MYCVCAQIHKHTHTQMNVAEGLQTHRRTNNRQLNASSIYTHAATHGVKYHKLSAPNTK